jgi:hypothetical protein
MGLLDYEKLMGNPLLMAGLGILSNNNSRNAGQVIGNGLMQGFGNVAQFQEMQRKKQAQEQEQKMRQAQFDMQKSEYERKISEQQNRQSAMQRLLGGQQSYMKEQEVPFSYQKERKPLTLVCKKKR